MKGIQNQQPKLTDPVLNDNKVKLQYKLFQDGHQEVLSLLESSIVGKSIIVEAQRTVKVLDQLIQDLEYCLYLDADFIARFSMGKLQKDLKLQLTEETIKLLQQQADLEQKFKAYANLHIAINQGEEIEESKKLESERLENLLQQNFKNLLRRMQHNPKEFEILKSMKRNTNIELSEYLQGVKCLRIILLKQLSTTKAEKNIQIQQFDNFRSKLQEQEKTKKLLEQDLQYLKKQNNINIDELKEQIDELKQQLQKLKIDKQENAGSLQNTLKSHYQNLEKNQQTQIDQLLAELQSLRSRFIKLRDENTQEEIKLKRLKLIQDQALSEGVQNYDLTMEESTEKLTTLQKECSIIQKQLRDRKQYFQIVDAQKKKENELEDEFKRIRDQHYIKQQQKSEAAKHIQSFFKSYQISQKKTIKSKQG